MSSQAATLPAGVVVAASSSGATKEPIEPYSPGALAGAIQLDPGPLLQGSKTVGWEPLVYPTFSSDGAPIGEDFPYVFGAALWAARASAPTPAGPDAGRLARKAKGLPAAESLRSSPPRS